MVGGRKDEPGSHSRGKGQGGEGEEEEEERKQQLAFVGTEEKKREEKVRQKVRRLKQDRSQLIQRLR